MEYCGKLYGKVGDFYFPMEETTEDIELLRERVSELEERLASAVSNGEAAPMCSIHNEVMDRDSMSHEYYCYTCEYKT